MKIVTIIGARPQFIKATVVSRAISDFNQHITANPLPEINEVIVHTGQHYDRNMSDVFFEEMAIPRPDYFLDIHGLSHGTMTGQMLEKIEPVLVEEKLDAVLDQKEAFFFKKPCITLRDETEWVELVEQGFNLLTGAETENIYGAYKAIIETDLDYNIELYGDGNSGEKIVEFFK
jgi:UDP-N-acetylglucosamine 2-epimerase